MKSLQITLTILLFGITAYTISCKAQTVSLETIAQCMQENPSFSCPNNFNYVKDVNNTLNKYVGIWKGNFNGKTYEINIIKKEFVSVDGVINEDRLVGRLRITTTGNVPLTIFDNFNEIDDLKTNFEGVGLTSNLQHYMMSFSDSSPKGCINYGKVYFSIKPVNPPTLNIYYIGNHDIVEGECPNTFTTTIPEKQNIYLKKQ